MSILIKCMEMPRSCDGCDFAVELNERELGTHLYCGFPGIGVYVDDCVFSVHKDCPLIEIPDKHGRLIDADALEQDAQKRLLVCNKYDDQFQKPYEVMRAIALAPTIIPADYPPSVPLKQVWAEVFGEECE